MKFVDITVAVSVRRCFRTQQT